MYFDQMGYVERYIIYILYIYVHQYTWYLNMVDLLMTELPAARRGTRRGMRTGTQERKEITKPCFLILFY